MSRLLVLGWHNVEGTWCFPAAPGAGLRGLARQLRWLRRCTTVVPLQSALEDLAAGRRLPRRAVALTFDDGYADNLELAAPVLARLGLPASFFLVPGLLDREVRAWWEDLAWAFARATAAQAHLDGGPVPLRSGAQRRVAYGRVAAQLKQHDRAAREAQVDLWVERLHPAGDRPHGELFLDWHGARALVRQGFAIGSHTTAHAVLGRETPQAQGADLVHAAHRLRTQLGVAVDVLAYPNGRRQDYDAATVAAVRSAGHRFAVTTQVGLADRRTPPYEVPRAVVEPAWTAGRTAREAGWWLRDLRRQQRQRD